MKKPFLFWLPAFMGIVLSILLIFIGMSSYRSSKEYKNSIEIKKISKVQKALQVAYHTRKKTDLTEIQLFINDLDNGKDKIKYSKKLSSLEAGITQIKQIDTTLNNLKNKFTEQKSKEVQKLIDDLTDETFQKDKKQFLKTLNTYKKDYFNKLKYKKVVALTFDDGPNPETTPLLLEILEKKNVPATFFALGENAQANPNIIKEEAQKGHEVASHTWDHSDLKTLSVTEQRKEILNANQTINQLTGQNITLYRPPYGSYDNAILQATPLTVVNWSVDTNDWRYRTSEPVVENALTYTYDGAIILMHDIHPWSVNAVPQIIDSLRQEGYDFVTVSTLLNIKNGEIKPQTAYFD